jgi:predicted RNase H-like HicB family nuclease
MTPRYSYRVAWSEYHGEWFAISPEWGRINYGSGDTPQAAMAALDAIIADLIVMYQKDGHNLPQVMDAGETAFYLVESWE